MKRPDPLAKLTRTPALDYLTAATAPTVEAVEAVSAIAVGAILPSPYQPPGRASTAASRAVHDAVTFAGSFAALVGTSDDDAANERGRLALGKLDRQEARPLAELAADMAARLQDGRDPVEVPLEARRVADGLELIAGHRRLAAARLAGVEVVPVRDRGPMDDATAAEQVFRNNRLRADFTPWQEARALAVLRAARKAARPDDRRAGSTRDLARLMGYSVGRATELLQMVDAFPPALTQAMGDGLEAAGDERLARLSYAALRKLIGVKDPDERLAAARELVNPTKKAPAPRLVGEPPEQVPGVYARRNVRGGGYALTVFQPASKLPVEGARALLAFYEAQVKAIRAALTEGDR